MHRMIDQLPDFGQAVIVLFNPYNNDVGYQSFNANATQTVYLLARARHSILSGESITTETTIEE